MRPPQNAGEDSGRDLAALGLVLASMRPPQNAGEDLFLLCEGRTRHGGFNETPAERGGRPQNQLALLRLGSTASMRPPQNAGEDDDEQAAIAQLIELQ